METKKMKKQKGFIFNPKISDSDLDKIVSVARKNGFAMITIDTPDDQNEAVRFEVTKRPKGYSRVLMDMFSGSWDITLKGQKAFCSNSRGIPDPEERKEVFCGKRIMRIDIKETGEGMVLAYILEFLKNGEYVEKMKNFPTKKN